MQNLEVSNFGLIACLEKNLEARLDEGRSAPAKNGLFAKEVGLGLFFEGSLQKACACGADPACPCHGDRACLAGGVLLDCKEGRDPATFLILATHDVARAFRSNEDDIHVLRGFDCFIVNGKAVAEEEALTLAKIRGDIFLVDGWNLEVRDGHKDDVGRTNRLGSRKNFKAVFFCDSNGLAAFVKTDGDFDATIFEVEGMGVALGAKADDSHTAFF